MAADHGAGIVVTGQDALSAAELARSRGFTGPLLCDAGAYAGARRKSAGRGIRPGWCRRQQELGLVALTDSGYLAPRNWAGLHTVLQATARQPAPTIAVLPLAARWFAAPPIRRALTEVINAHGVPVALVIEHSADPFGVQYLLSEFLQLLTTATVPVLLLRSDVSALGALAHGAHSAAIGMNSALRHLYPVRSGGGHPSETSAFVRHLLSFHYLDRCAQAFARTPQYTHLWNCDCPVCAGATPAQLGDGIAPTNAAALHSLHAQLEVYAEIHRPGQLRDQRISSWHEACSHALSLHEEIAQHVPEWRIPKTLQLWSTLTADPLPYRGTIPRPATERTPQDRPHHIR